MGTFVDTWPAYAARAVLLCSLLACSLVDVRHWIVPLEVCWFAAAVGLAANTADPAPALVPQVGATAATMSAAAAVGLIVSMLLVRRGLLLPSFLDAEEAPANADAPPRGVAITAANGVNPRREILREVAYLAPPAILAAAAFLLLHFVPSLAGRLERWVGPRADWAGAAYVNGFAASLFGYLIGGLWIWAIRIGGTLAFAKEAMGLGDVHLLAAVGAVCGWIVPTLVFFAAPSVALLWAMQLLISRRQRELPYGPHLAIATGLVLLFYDGIVHILSEKVGLFWLVPTQG